MFTMKKLFVFILCVAISGTVCSQSKKELKAQIGNLSKEIELKDIEIVRLHKENKDLKTQELDLKRQIERLKGKELRIKSLVKDSINSRKIIKEQEKLLASYSEQLNRLDSAITTLNNLVANLASQQKETSRRNVEKNNGTSRQKAVRDSIARVKFQTTDLKMVSAHGPVKSIVYNESRDPVLFDDKIFFNENGLITKMNESIVIKRNPDNSLDEWGFDWDVEGGTKYECVFNADGFVKKITKAVEEGYKEYIFSWDKTGKLIKIIVDVRQFDLSYTDKYRYRYLKTDKFGNWIEAEETNSYKDWDGTTQTQKTKITRTIEYYE